MSQKNYDLIVVGAGHAGIEAAFIASKFNLKVALINLYEDKIATMPCNPSIGGPAKGILVREIDALGGIMAKAADATYLQMKLLNCSKGPAVRALRAQIDKIEYSKYVKKLIDEDKNIDLVINLVTEIIVENNVLKGIILKDGIKIFAKALVLTTGTYMSSLILKGKEIKKEGPNGQITSSLLSTQLKELGFEFIRFKTGTPPRIMTDSIDFNNENIIAEPGSDRKISFSFTNKRFVPLKDQKLCWLLHSTNKTHKIVNLNLKKSPMYSDRKNGIGPRYCPSFEDKIVKFKTKPCHQIFLEPISLSLNTTYMQGFSTSMPNNIQLEMIHSLPGLKNAKIATYAYAIEYDCFVSTQLKKTLETKKITNLYTAGQINGTSGYEEAAVQGLMAGINASLKILNKKELILERSEAYIGVLIDDIVTKRLYEPYRMLTSRAEYRLVLRNDNAEVRLKPIANKLGLISKKEYNDYILHIKNVNFLIGKLKKFKIKPNDSFANFLKLKNITIINEPLNGYALLKRPKVQLLHFKPYIAELDRLTQFDKENLEINIKYEGYIKQEQESIKKFHKLEKKQIPLDINYDKVLNLATEAREKLKEILPLTIGQATRISGINPSDIQMLLYYLKNKYAKDNKK